MNYLGRHVIVDLYECDPAKLNDCDLIRNAMIESALAAGATIVGDIFHHFAPQGVSGAVVIAESHISIHTWPELGYAACDLFTCGKSVDPWKAFELLREALNCQRHKEQEIQRGIFPYAVEHKPPCPSAQAGDD